MRAPVALASWLLVGMSAASLVGSCVSHTPPSLEDSTGLRVQWECSGSTCEVTGSSGPPPVCTALPDIDLFVLGASSFALVCGASVVGRTLELHEASCRPIRCAAAIDCPQWDDRAYGCDAGLCTTTGRALDMLDVTALCLADVDRPPTCALTESDPATIEAMAHTVGACDETGCVLPEACR